MIAIINKFINSRAWDKRHNLPLVPEHNNPFIYNAYAYKIIHMLNPYEAKTMLLDFHIFLNSCVIKEGLYYRWPDKSGGPTSHDELMGIAYVSSIHAKHILNYLRNHLGCYDNGLDPQKKFRFFRFNLYRLPWFIVFLKVCAKRKIWLHEKLIFSLFLRMDAYFYKEGDEGGRLRIWLMLDKMKMHVPGACRYWRNKMVVKNVHLHECFTKYFPNIPEFAENSHIF